MRLLIDLDPVDPALGLAIEEVLLDSVRQDGVETIRIWINDHAVVMGRSQSTAAEVDEAQACKFGIPVIRRISGGGTVYHYPGNLNVSVFLRKRHDLSQVSSVFRFFGLVLVEALSRLVPCLHSEDNGLYIGGLKVGGAAQAHRGDAILFHTTLLVRPASVPMEKLLLAMRPGYRPEGIASRPRTTTSLSEYDARSIDPEEVVEPIVDALASALGESLDAGRLTAPEAKRAAELRTDKYGSPMWNRKH
ncbi:biotin/lipoate A/B protein ligase family protein [Candidatus Bipolaricaulota bacterium]